MTLQRATQYALVGAWIYFLSMIFNWIMSAFVPGFFNSPWAVRILWLVEDISLGVPLIVFFRALAQGQSGDSSS